MTEALKGMRLRSYAMHPVLVPECVGSVTGALRDTFGNRFAEVFAGEDEEDDGVEVDVGDPASALQAMGIDENGMITLWGSRERDILVHIMGSDTSRLAAGNNVISIELTQPSREDVEPVALLFDRLVERTRSAYAHGELDEEYEAQNLHRGPDGTYAVGVDDLGRQLPGVYWLNFFGPHLLKRIGRPESQIADAYPLAGGIRIRAYRDPWSWATPTSERAKQTIRSQLGRGHFFERDGD